MTNSVHAIQTDDYTWFMYTQFMKNRYFSAANSNLANTQTGLSSFQFPLMYPYDTLRTDYQLIANTGLSSANIGLSSWSGMKDSHSNPKVKTVGDEMTTPTREEIDAKLAAVDLKLEAVEARTETRFVQLSEKMERILDAVDRSNSDHLRTAGETKDQLNAVNQSIAAQGRDTRNVIIGAIVAGILAALAAIWTTQSILIASFQTGIPLHDIHSQPPPPPAPAAAPGPAPAPAPASPAPQPPAKP
jgi:hypothetical protein